MPHQRYESVSNLQDFKRRLAAGFANINLPRTGVISREWMCAIEDLEVLTDEGLSRFGTDVVAPLIDFHYESLTLAERGIWEIRKHVIEINHVLRTMERGVRILASIPHHAAQSQKTNVAEPEQPPVLFFRH